MINANQNMLLFFKNMYAIMPLKLKKYALNMFLFLNKDAVKLTILKQKKINLNNDVKNAL